jgi:peptidoglycan/LPS O-acetylase OafA/YrhL
MSSPAVLPRRDALDGLRAVAVLAVVVYHVDGTLLPGGFVGVDLFFVLSGYLITSLLLAEHARVGQVSLRGFWGRRMRRLWPLAWVTLAVIAVASLAGVWGADRQRTLPSELSASFGHVANWFQTGREGYVQASQAPSPVRHFWSLAIEEQFYLFWPLLLVALLSSRLVYRRWLVPAVLAVLAAGSVAAGFAAGSPDRAYLGTDVRLVALVVGALLAWMFKARPLQAPSRRAHQRLLVVWGALGVAGLAALCLVVSPDASWLSHGGFALVAVAAAGVVAASLVSSKATAVLSSRPLVFVGRLSFGLYLVHWPLLVALGPSRPVWLRLTVALPVALAVAYVLHRLVERPVMERRPRPVFLAGSTAVLASVTAVALLVAVPSGVTPTEQVSRSLGQVPDPTVPAAVTPAGETTVPPAPCVPATIPPRSFGQPHRFDPETVATLVDPTGGCTDQVKVLIVGDSTGRGAANGLAALSDARIQVWDRTVLGCSFGPEKCPDWHDIWAVDVMGIDPDVVLVYNNTAPDLHSVDDAPFLSSEATVQRTEQLTAAVALLSSGGAKVLLTTPAAPTPPRGLFFCDGGRQYDSQCDPSWAARWGETVRQVAASTGAGVVDTGGWVVARGSTFIDRPDGAHLAGPALVEHAHWLVPQLLTAAGR